MWRLPLRAPRLSECWGEFLDHEWYYQGVAVREPWRRHRLAARCFQLPRGLVAAFAQPARLRDVSADPERVGVIRASLLRDGLQAPLEVVVDGRGRLVLRDGHHRLLASDGIRALARLPVYFTRSEHIRTDSRPVADVLEDLLRAVIA